MPAKRKDQDDETTPAPPTKVKKLRLSSTAANRQAAAALATTSATSTPKPSVTSTPKPLVESKTTLTEKVSKVVDIKSSKNSSYCFGATPTDEGILHALETCIAPEVPLHSLVHPEATKLYDNFKVYSLLPPY